MTVELIVLDHFKRTFGHLVNMLRLEKIFKMFRVITIEKSHQTTRFRHYHTQQADKQPVSNKPVAIMCNFNTLTFTQTNFFPNSFSNDSTSIDSFLTIFETLLQTAFRKILINASNGRRKFSNDFVNASNAREKISNDFLNATNAQLKFSNGYSNVSNDFSIRLNGYQTDT